MEHVRRRSSSSFKNILERVKSQTELDVNHINASEGISARVMLSPRSDASQSAPTSPRFTTQTTYRDFKKSKSVGYDLHNKR